MDAKDLLARTREDGVKFIALQFTDVTGSVKSLDIPVEQLIDVFRAGTGERE